MKINRIAIISIPVKDQQLAKAFYTEKLGFTVQAENPMGPNQTWIQLGIPGAQTSITLVTWFDNMPPGSAQGMVLDTSDIVGDHAELQAKGVDVSPVEAQPWGTFS